MNKASFASGILRKPHLTEGYQAQPGTDHFPDLEHFLSLNDVTLHGEHIHCVLDRGKPDHSMLSTDEP